MCMAPPAAPHAWCACGLVLTPLGSCLAICRPNGSQLLTGKVAVRLAPLCRLLASMLAIRPSSTAERRVRIGGLTVIARANEDYCVAVIVTDDAHATSASLATAQLVHAVEAHAGDALRHATASERARSELELGSYTASLALNGSVDAAAADLRSLPRFADLETRVLAPILSACPHAEAWTTALALGAASAPLCGFHLLRLDGAGARGCDELFTCPRALLDARTSEPHRAALVGRLEPRALRQLVRRLGHGGGEPAAPLRGGPLVVGEAGELRAVAQSVPLEPGAVGSLVLIYAAPQPRPVGADANASVGGLSAEGTRAWPAARQLPRIFWGAPKRPRVQPRPNAAGQLAAGGDLLAEHEQIPDEVVRALAALSGLVRDAFNPITVAVTTFRGQREAVGAAPSPCMNGL